MKKSILTLLLLIVLSVFLQAQNKEIKVFPNPLVSQTTITLPDSLKLIETVQSQIYNAKGQLVKKWVNAKGSITWDAKDQFGRNVESGIYFYRMTNGRFTASKKIVLLK